MDMQTFAVVAIVAVAGFFFVRRLYMMFSKKNAGCGCGCGCGGDKSCAKAKTVQ